VTLLDPLYRVLGVIASINGRFWRIRVNGLPANVGIFILLAWGAFTGFENYTEARRNGAAPARQSLAGLLSGRSDPEPQYVSLRGVLLTDARIEYGTKGADGSLTEVEKVWVPLADRESGRALLVQLSQRHEANAEAELTGMLRPMDSRLRSELTYGYSREAGPEIDRRFVLVEGETPATAADALVLGISCGVVLLLFAIAASRRNVIFVPHQTTEPAPPPQDIPSLFVSGTLHFDESNRQRFVNVPATVDILESGDRAIVSHIDASAASGAWMLAIRPGSVTDIQHGYIFDGWKRLRAVRFRYVSAMDGASDRAILSATSGDPAFALQG
jgi:hypothetical protein